MLRKMLSLGALVVVAASFGVGTASAKPFKPIRPTASDGFSDGRLLWVASGLDGFSDGRLLNLPTR
jgi:hypothetical protein